MTGALAKIKDIIFSKQLKTEDVIRRMKLSRSQAALNRQELAAGLK